MNEVQTSEEIPVDQRLRMRAVEVSLSAWVKAPERVDLFELITDIYEFIKGDRK
jgi:hypothetical protein